MTAPAIAPPSLTAAAASLYSGRPPPVPEVLFQARGLIKTYALGDVEVTALQGVDLDLARG
jgi:putative ABC transport system ATP-binding protein